MLNVLQCLAVGVVGDPKDSSSDSAAAELPTLFITKCRKTIFFFQQNVLFCVLQFVCIKNANLRP